MQSLGLGPFSLIFTTVRLRSCRVFFGLKCDKRRNTLGKSEMRSYQDNMLRYMSGQIEPRKQ